MKNPKPIEPSQDNLNPYLPSALVTNGESPDEGTRGTDQNSKASVLRGIVLAIPPAALGYSIPMALMLITLLVRFTDSSYPSRDRGNQLINLPGNAIVPGIACAVLFGLAAFLNYAPAQRLGLVRALMFVGGWLMVGLILATAIVSQFYGPFVRSLSDEEQTARTVLGAFIAFSVPLIYTAVHTAFRFRHLPKKATLASDNENNPL